MATIKKAYTDIIDFLQSNDDQLVSDILPEVVAMASAKAGGGGSRATTFHRNEEGLVVGVKCYYFGTWMSPEVVAFGKKASSATGFNSMCKEGVSHWTKQQSTFSKARAVLLDQVMAGEVAAEDLAAITAELEEAKTAVTPREDEYGFASLEELLEDNANRGVSH
tara:strand:- start:290 stop:784 length:495 start_codon:yes stop_codon:yes gene_type:complete